MIKAYNSLFIRSCLYAVSLHFSVVLFVFFIFLERKTCKQTSPMMTFSQKNNKSLTDQQKKNKKRRSIKEQWNQGWIKLSRHMFVELMIGAGVIRNCPDALVPLSSRPCKVLSNLNSWSHLPSEPESRSASWQQKGQKGKPAVDGDWRRSRAASVLNVR